MNRRYEHAGLGLTLMGGALVIGILEGTTGLHLMPLVWAIPVGIVALIMGGMAFMLPILVIAFTPMWVADQVRTHRQVKADRMKRTQAWVPVTPQPTPVQPAPFTAMADPLQGKTDKGCCPECGKALRYVTQHLLRQHNLHGVFIHPFGGRSHWLTYA